MTAGFKNAVNSLNRDADGFYITFANLRLSSAADMITKAQLYRSSSKISHISLSEKFRRGKDQQPTPQGEHKATADRSQTSDCHPV